MRIRAVGPVTIGFAWLLSGGNAEADCKPLSFQTAKSEIRSVLKSEEYTDREIRFILSGAQSDLARLKARDLGMRTRSCGIEWARAHILRCTAEGIPALLRATTKPPESVTAVSRWGKKNLSVRETIFVGGFEGCLVTARKLLFR